jgi:hypothetical protein
VKRVERTETESGASRSTTYAKRGEMTASEIATRLGDLANTPPGERPGDVDVCTIAKPLSISTSSCG